MKWNDWNEIKEKLKDPEIIGVIILNLIVGMMIVIQIVRSI
jgi:hypothetical protein